MLIRFALRSLALLTLACGMLMPVVAQHDASANKQRLSLEEYRLKIEEIQQEVDEFIKREFAEQEAELKLLAEPYELGSRVSILRLRGPNRYVATEGTFRELNIAAMPAYARIGDTRVPYEDIHPVDQQRLLWGARTDKKQLADNLAQQRQRLERQKANVSRVEFTKRLNNLGYTQTWRQGVVPVNGYLWEMTDLGHGTVEVSVLISDLNPFAQVRINNRTQEQFAFTAFLGNRPIATNLPRAFGAAVPMTEWRQFAFWMDKEDLQSRSELPVMLSQQLTLSVLKRDVGNWTLRPTYSTHRTKSSTIDRRVCPECFGSQRIPTDASASTPIAPVVDMEDLIAAGDPVIGVEDTQLSRVAPAGTDVACPRCRGEGTLSSESHRLVSVDLTFEVVTGENRIQDYTSRVADEWIASAQPAWQYQDTVQSRIQEIQEAARKDRIENAEEIERREAQRRRELEREKEFEARKERIERNYTWYTPHQARQDLKPSIRNARSDYYYEPTVDFPSELVDANRRKIEVERFTMWYQPPTRVNLRNQAKNYHIFQCNYRIIKGKHADGRTVYLLQYALRAEHDSASGQLRLKTTINVLERESDKTWTEVHPYLLDASWFGTMVGIIPIEADTLINGIKDLVITAEAE